MGSGLSRVVGVWCVVVVGPLVVERVLSVLGLESCISALSPVVEWVLGVCREAPYVACHVDPITDGIFSRLPSVSKN
jgi:hypothetical protein